jgi:hypothetical protein
MEAHYDQFIGYYPKVVSPEKCNQVINYFEQMVEIQRNYNRQSSEDALQTVKKDEAVNGAVPRAVTNADHFIVANGDPTTDIVGQELMSCITDYVDTYDILKENPMMAMYHKIQKTLPQGGYHVWHCEQGNGAQMRRVLVYTLYLNDVEEGGETEFLYQQKRYPARKGDICIFPAHFTHPHRGNPPLSGEKYIMTGWTESIEIPDGMQLAPK